MGVLGLSKTRLFLLGCLLLGGYFTYTAAVNALHHRQLDAGEEALAREVEDLRAKQAHLEGVLAYVASDTYVEQAARRELGFVREGEIPFVVLSPPSADLGASGGEWWQRLFPR